MIVHLDLTTIINDTLTNSLGDRTLRTSSGVPFSNFTQFLARQLPLNYYLLHCTAPHGDTLDFSWHAEDLDWPGVWQMTRRGELLDEGRIRFEEFVWWGYYSICVGIIGLRTVT